MGAAKKIIDKKALRDFIPINALSAAHLQEISNKAVIEDIRQGGYIFRAGARDNQTVYLLEGEVELLDARRRVVETLKAGSDIARHPLAHKQPRQCDVRAAGNVTIARIDTSLLDVLLTWDESAGYDVVELDTQDDDDWMTRMLQSQAFLQLPPSNIHQLLMRLETVTASAGDMVVHQGEDGDYFYIVKSGRLAVTRKASARSKEVLLAELGEGACFGEEALVSGTKRNASVMMITDGSLMRLSKQDFNELLCAPLVHEADYEGALKLAAKGARWLDVRLPGEYENGAIKGSANLPLSALREQCDQELDADVDYIVCCDTGRRSAAGAFVLSQRGYNVYTLKNGLMGVPEGDLTRQTVRSPSAQDAEIIPFDADNRAEPEPEPDAGDGALEEDDAALIDRLAALESEKLAFGSQVEALNDQLQQTPVDDGQAAALRGQVAELETRLVEIRREHEQHVCELDGQLRKTREDYQQLGQRTSAVAGERDEARRALSELHGETETLQTRIREHEQSLEAQRGESEALRQALELARDESRKLSGELEAAGQQHSQGEALQRQLAEAEQQRETLSVELEAVRAQLLQVGEQSGSELERLRGEHESETQALEAQIERLGSELEQLRGDSQGEQDRLSATLQTLQQAHEALQRQYTELGAERDGQCQRVAELEQRLAETQQALDSASGQVDADKDTYTHQIETLQQTLDSEQERNREHSVERETLAQRLTDTQKQVQAAQAQVEELRQQLDEQRKQAGEEHARIQGHADQASTRVAELEETLKQERDALTTLQAGNGELNARIAAMGEDHETDIASTREALSRAQTETENIKREQSRLMEQLRKAERALEQERQDHESEVRRLHKEMQEAAGESSEALAAELEALQARLKDDARSRDDLQIQLGERSAQLENAQAEAEKLTQQLQQAQQSAREAEQQLVESNTAANAEMAVRMEAEEKAQQGLRVELAGTIAERNQAQEKLTVHLQELEDLRGALQAYQERASGAENARDAALAEQELIQQELDQLRAEAEVTRGLVAMAAPAEAADEALREELVQAKKNVDVAVRLRSQAEQKAEQMESELERLRSQLFQFEAPPAMEEADSGAIPSLDSEDPQAATALNPDYVETEVVSQLIDDDDEAAADAGPNPALQMESPSGGRGRALLILALLVAVAGAGGWWMLKKAPVSPAASVPGESLSAVPVEDSPVKETQATQPAGDAATSGTPSEGDGQGQKSPAPALMPPVASVSEPAPAQDERTSAAVANLFRGGSLPERSPPPAAEPAAEPESTTAVIDTPAPAEPDPVPRHPAQPLRTFSEPLADGGRGPRMVELQADSFEMGSSATSANFDERPRHTVSLKRFSIAQREVSFAEYAQFASATGRRVPADAGWGRGQRPVINVRWKDAAAYANWLSEQTGSRYRLPTEAEWEYAARAGSETRFWWGNDVGESNANCFDCGGKLAGQKTAPVGSFAASPYGVQDMAGNVREWVEDCYAGDYSAAPADGGAFLDAGCDSRVVRGGSYVSPSSQLRSSSRELRDPNARLDDLGFRVVRD